ncbi:hypothetical protein N7509_008812 [Penicillium cosmopolitanum]|uniref:Uncharacterized protein n=1 Tax=Penicillium cosmopolitanum TaxID=1131564 RepID=A0A9X0B327_9EURO|nr:uncharacterized protein N7509_008812 [Penicillium cosmopolitanum]KAJ5386271.1 hypothetical protein N7509_008812 [Penicillium cosmopolitanum]
MATREDPRPLSSPNSPQFSILRTHYEYGWEIGERSGERDTSHPMLIALVGAPDPPNDEHTNDVEILHEPQSPGWRHFLAIGAAIANHSASLASPLIFSSRVNLDSADSRSVVCGAGSV